MKLLIVTQVVDKEDPILGFFHRWLEEFGKHCESIEVICLRKGRVALPSHIHVHSLGKERGGNRLIYVIKFYTSLIKLHRTYDSVFVHMNPEYVVLGGALWRLLGKRIGLWYMHRSITLLLRLAERIVHVVFTGSSESFRIESNKKVITGHGIDIEHFAPRPCTKDIDLLTVGRISRSKNLTALLDALKLIRKENNASFSIVGLPITSADREYQGELNEHLKNNNLSAYVHFLGAVSPSELPYYLCRARVFLHAAQNGSLDKAILESLAAGVPVITMAEGAQSLPLEDWQVNSVEALAEQTIQLLKNDQILEQTGKLRSYVKENHSLQSLIPTILTHLRNNV